MDTVIDYFIKFGKEFFSFTLMVLPWFIVGVVFGALLERYLNPNIARKYLGKGFGAIVNASLLGAILPGCSCATVPMANGLRQSGSSLATVAAFIMVSPLLSPHTLILNYGILGLPFTIARVVFSLIGAILLGIIIMFISGRKPEWFRTAEMVPMADDSCGCDDNCACEPGKGKSFWRSLYGNFMSLGKYFLMGMVLATLLTTLIPQDSIPKYLGSGGPLTYLAAIVVGIPLYVCEGEEIPITLALTQLGFGYGPSLAFLLGAVGTCIPTLAMAPKVIGKRATVLYFVYWLFFALTSGLIFGFIMQK